MNVLSFQDARRVVEQHAAEVRPTDAELIDLLAAAGRVLAQDIAADRDFPPFPRATRDGYALHAADLDKLPSRLEVVGEIRAGADVAVSACPLARGEAVEIMTGAPAPPGSDAIVMVEYTRREGDFVVVERAVAAGENIVPAGSEARAGEVALARGTRIGPAQIAVAASVGHAQLQVYRRPRVAILATGDEIVDVAAEPRANQIRNSNSYSIAAQVELAGGDPLLLPIAPDEPEQLRLLVGGGLGADLLLLAGGVSMGKYDLVEQVLAAFDAEFFFTGATIQPGKPIVFGRARRHADAAPTYFFGLPGNPVSTMVTFEIFARPILDALRGAAPTPL